MKDWLETNLGHEIDLRTGFPFKSAEYTYSNDDIRLLRGDNIVQGSIRWDVAARWPRAQAADYEDFYLKEGDVVLAMDRPWIEAGLKQARISKDDLPALQVQRTARLRGGARLDISYLRYIIAGAPFTKYVKQVNTGSNVPHISSKQIRDFKVSLPPIADQKRIAKVLSTLDAKIELNNRINAELEAMAKLLYDYWFVQFDFPCLPSDYKPLGAGKLDCHDGDSPVGASKPVDIEAACNYRAVGGLPIPEKGKHFVYVLLCSDDSFYIGMTDDLYRRWHQHKTGQGAKWTKANSPVKVIHHEVFDSRSAASEREKELKTGFGRKWLKREYEKLSKPEGSPTHQSKHAKAGSPAHQSKLMQAGPMTYNPTLKREIPKGWDARSIASLTAISKENTCPANEPNKVFKLFSIPTFDQIKTYGLNLGKSIGSDKFVVSQDDLLVSKLNPWFSRVIYAEDEEDMVCSTEFVVWRTSSRWLKNYLYMVSIDPRFIGHCVQSATGTSNSHKRVNPNVMVSHLVPYDEEIVKSFAQKIGPMIQAKLNNQKQNQELTALRDWLLPMLMNGQVTVDE